MLRVHLLRGAKRRPRQASFQVRGQVERELRLRAIALEDLARPASMSESAHRRSPAGFRGRALRCAAPPARLRRVGAVVGGGDGAFLGARGCADGRANIASADGHESRAGPRLKSRADYGASIHCDMDDSRMALTRQRSIVRRARRRRPSAPRARSVSRGASDSRRRAPARDRRRLRTPSAPRLAAEDAPMSSWRTFRISVYPSSPGIAMSLRSTSGRRCRISSSASAADSTAVTSAPRLSRIALTSPRASASLSTTSTRMPSSEGRSSGRRLPDGPSVFRGHSGATGILTTKVAPRPVAVAARRDRAAMQLHEMPDDREAEAEAAVLSRAGGILLAEPIEHVREELGLDPGARIGDAETRSSRRLASSGNGDESALRRELDGVVQQVPDRPAACVDGIAEDRGGALSEFAHERDALGGGRRERRLERGVERSNVAITDLSSRRSLPVMMREMSSRSSMSCACSRVLRWMISMARRAAGSVSWPPRAAGSIRGWR